MLSQRPLHLWLLLLEYKLLPLLPLLLPPLHLPHPLLLLLPHLLLLLQPHLQLQLKLQ